MDRVGCQKGRDMPSTNRRRFLGAMAAIPAGSFGSLARAAQRATPSAGAIEIDSSRSWEEVRDLFELRTDRIHMAGLLFASNPRPVSAAIAGHRAQLQRDPASYISHERWRLEAEV